MTQDGKAHKIRLTRAQRFRRLLAATIDPRAWGHALKVANYYNYTNAAPWRQVKRGKGGAISPLANIANPQNLIVGDRVRISANVHLWPGPGTGKIILRDDVMIGPGVLIAASNYRYNDGSPVTDQAMDEADILIGRDVWIGYGAMILAGTEIGDGCIIGAGSVVRGRIAPFSVVAGNPAKVVGRRRDMSQPEAPVEMDGFEPVSNASVVARLQVAFPGRDETALSAPLDAAGIDSFDLMTLRMDLEDQYGLTIPDREWMSIRSVLDIARLPSLARGPQSVSRGEAVRIDPGASIVAQSSPVKSLSGVLAPGYARRELTLNMPQMALSGLSESWLFKELGDIHWAMITDFLKAPSSAIMDDTGERLYATFTRISLELEPSLRGFVENDPLTIDARLQRHGAGFFFGHHDLLGRNGRGVAQTMSTFAKHGERGKNTSLIKGTPTLPDPDAIPSMSAMPDFGQDYRTRRAREPGAELFSCSYEILPPHDINGVGLLYFAVYPTIFDLCLEKAEGQGFLISSSTVSKDIFYYANSEPDERLRFVLHARSEDPDGVIRHEASLFRTSDGKRMAEVISRKRPL